MNEILQLLRRMNSTLERIESQSRQPDDSDEISAKEALRVMRCSTMASLTALAKLFPSIKTRRGFYSKANLRRALNARATITHRRK